MRWMFLFIAVLSVGCTNDTAVTVPTATPSATNVPATVTLTATLSSGSNAVASIIATVRDSSGLAVTAIPVSFSTTAGFITSPAETNTVGTAEAILSNVPAGTTATITATATSAAATVSANVAAHF